MRFYFLLITAFLVFNNLPQSAYSGGSDGSEVLGGNGGLGAKNGDSENFLDYFQKMLSGASDKNGDNKRAFNSEIPLDCKVTPQIDPDYLPLNQIQPTGNLLRKAGSPYRAKGYYVYIRGKIVDEDCLPVSNAVIESWQADSSGKYEGQYELKSEWDVLDKSFDKNFAYSGTAQTNNVGEFNFLTILPGVTGSKFSPHINLSIEHPDFKDVSTMMFFDGNPRNSIDRNLNDLDSEGRKLVIAQGKKIDPEGKYDGRVYDFLITLKGINKYRKY